MKPVKPVDLRCPKHRDNGKKSKRLVTVTTKRVSGVDVPDPLERSRREPEGLAAAHCVRE